MLLNSDTLINQGTLQNGNTVNNEITGTLNNQGTIVTNNGTFNNYGTKTGIGHVAGSYIDDGHTQPGNFAGVITIDGDYLKVGGSKEIELGGHFHGGGDNSLTEYDGLDMTGWM